MIKTLLLLLATFLLTACESDSRLKQTVLLAPEGLFAAALSEHYVLLAATTGPAQLWRLESKPKLQHTWQHTNDNDGIIKVALSADERYALTAERHSFAWWRIEDGRLMDVWSLPNIQSLALSADGEFALIGLEDKAIYFALAYGRTLYAFQHEAPVRTVALSASGQYAATGAEDKQAKLWRLDKGQLVHTWKHANSLMTLAISPDDRYVLSNAELGPAQLWRIKTGKRKQQLGPELLTLTSAVFTQDGLKVATGQIAGRLEIWQTSTGQRLRHWRTKKSEQGRVTVGTPLALAFIDHEHDLISINGNGYLQRWRK